MLSNTFQVLQPEIRINRMAVKNKAKEAEKGQVEQGICRPWVKRANFSLWGLKNMGSH